MLCPDAQPSFLNFFDFGVAPSLLFYSYIPIIFITLFFGIVVLRKSNYSLSSKLFFSISLFFCLWVLNILVQWVGAYVSAVHLAWELTALFEAGIYLSTAYFFLVFLEDKDISPTGKSFLFLFSLPIIALLPTSFNIEAFDLANCEGMLGLLWNYIYALEISIIGFVLFWGLRTLNQSLEPKRRKEVRLLTWSVVVFLFIFFLSNFYGELTRVYEFNLWGPIGMVVFLSLTAYMIVKFKTFDIKLVGAQALIFALIVLIGSQFFFIQNNTNRFLTAITLIITGAIGINLVRSVKKEVALRERIQKQEKELEKANTRLTELDQLKSEFVSLATHQIRGPLTAIKGYASMMIQGDLGKVPENLEGTIHTIYDSSTALTGVVQDFLDISRIEQGRMKYDFSIFDLGKLVYDVAQELDPTIVRKGLKIKLDIEKNLVVNADIGKLRQVFENLIDNAIKYSPKGTIIVTAKRTEEKMAQVSIKDNGVGIKPETLPKLFQKFSRAEDASKANILGTGLGLYVARQLITALKGTITAESEGEGKGSTFVVELPLKG